MRSRHEHLWMVRFQDRFRARLVVGLGIAIEEEDRASFDAEFLQRFAERCDLSVIERPLDLAIGQNAFVDLEAQRALDQRLMFLEEQVVGIRPVDAADLVDVAKALRDGERGARAGALEDRVDRDRGPVQKKARRTVVAPRPLHALVDAIDEARRRGQNLAEAQRAGAVVEHRNIGERAADIGRQANVRARLGSVSL